MKKKKQNAQSLAATAATAAADDLKSLIHENSLFFDKLVELIPAKFYLSSDDAKPWYQGLSKSAKASAKQQTRENIKKARRDRLDPEKSQTTTLDLLKKSIENEKAADKSKSDSDGENENEEEDADDVKPVEKFDGENRSVTYEELRQRLHRRIEELRANRGNGERPRSERRERRDIEYKKRKRDAESSEKSGADGSKLGKSEGEIEKDVTEATKGIEFGKVKIGGEEDVGRRKKRKLSKEKELERAKRLEEEKKDPEKGALLAKKHSWKAATERAAGIKVHDDPKLLKQSIQKEKKRHEKNAGKWKERVEGTEKSKAAKQQKRTENISERIHQKKMRKIAKREKKLMRPGFEGRKDGYINQE